MKENRGNLHTINCVKVLNTTQTREGGFINFIYSILTIFNLKQFIRRVGLLEFHL